MALQIRPKNLNITDIIAMVYW